MLRTNLSTRPFYNERVVYLLLAAAAVVVALLTLVNVLRLTSLTGEDRALSERVQATEQKAARLREEATRARSQIDRKQLEAVVAAAREANTLIDQRTFSWTELLNRLEMTLPPEVRIQSIKPVTDKEGQLEVGLVVLARRPEDIDDFMDQLEKSGAFRQLVSRAETRTLEGLLEVSLQGQYVPGGK